MRIVIVGGGMAGAGARQGAARPRRGPGGPRAAARRGRAIPGPIMLPSRPSTRSPTSGPVEQVRAAGPRHRAAARRHAGGHRGRPPGAARRACAAACSVHHEQEVAGLLRDGDRVVGVRVRGPRGARDRRRPGGRRRRHPLARARRWPASPPSCARRPAPASPSAARCARGRLPRWPTSPTGARSALLGWPGGSAGWWQIDRVGREAALAPGVEAYRRAFAPTAARRRRRPSRA